MQPYSFTDAPGLSGILLLEHPIPPEADTPVTAKRALLETIGHALTEASNTTLLTGGDITFLRHQMNLSLETLSSKFGVSSAQWEDWESGEVPIDKPAELLLRLLYRETLPFGHSKANEFLNKHADYRQEFGDRPRGDYYIEFNSCAQDWTHIKTPDFAN